MLAKIQKGIRILSRRISQQGVYVSFLWMFGRGLPMLTGKPILRFSEVTPQLYVGPQYRKNGLDYLKSQGIQAVVNLRIEKDDAKLGLAPANYCYLPTVDDEAPSPEHLEQGLRFIAGMISRGERVYIHCGAGVGRAPTMAAAYLISTGMSLDQALGAIRKVRPFIFITPPQMQALAKFEKQAAEKALTPLASPLASESTQP
ncbi:MAG TPA: dual specificity protein phosphatase [Anaerolinea sp.]|nr:dual specificity protein phosphatase [Anaerolinea sp.]